MINQNYLHIPGNYLFSEVAGRVAAYQEAHPHARLIHMGIGDVTRPLAPAVLQALHRAVDEMGREDTFHGYAPEQGYDFLCQAISEQEYAANGISIAPEEIFISDGAKEDCSDLQELFDQNCRVALCDPVYPVYAECNGMTGRAGQYDESAGRWRDIIYLPCIQENDYMPEIPREIPKLIYLCSPNNPTGVAMEKDRLQEWVDFANRTGGIIFFDGAYERYIQNQNVPHSIYSCSGAKTCAIEIRSFSKTAGFTGLRLGYTVIPKELKRDGRSIHRLWKRRLGARRNGVSYLTQRAGEAIYTPEGKKQVQSQIEYYKRNASLLRQTLLDQGYTVAGGVDSPYIWWKLDSETDSWSFFDRLLKQAHIIGTPGAGFGPGGEGYLRLTGFGSYEAAQVAACRLWEL